MALWFKIIFWIGVVACVGALGVYVFFETWTVPADDPLLAAAIAPTLAPGDVVLVTRRSTIDRGDLMRCPDPQAPGRYVVARAIAHWGDRLDLANEVVSIDGHTTPSPRACDPATVTVYNPVTAENVPLWCSVEEYGEADYTALRSREHPEPWTKKEIDPGMWFLLSDDRHVHLDSRDFGEVQARDCQHIVFRLVGAAGFLDAKTRLSIIW